MTFWNVLIYERGKKMDHWEKERIERSSNGSYEAYGELVQKYSNYVFATALSMTNDFYHAQDIAQEAFVKAWLHIHNLKEKEKFSRWILTITKNLCMDWLRKKVRRQELDLITDIPQQDERITKWELKESVWNVIESLNDNYRLLTIMHFMMGYTAKEISELTEQPLSTVESRLRRAKNTLKKELLDTMVEYFGDRKIGKEIEEDVMWRIVPRVSTLEIPVTNVKRSVEWYSEMLGTKAVHQDESAAMLHLQGGNRVGVPTLYLVQTESPERLSFKNTNTGVIHSVIDFYIQDLKKFHQFLRDRGVKVTNINLFPGSEYGGFGFEDPDGNLLSVTNVTHQGQI